MAMPMMQSVYSSHVTSIGHDAETGDLYVVWDSGKTSVYSGVKPEVAQEVANSWSVGSALSDQIKPNHPHRYLSDEE